MFYEMSHEYQVHLQFCKRKYNQITKYIILKST